MMLVATLGKMPRFFCLFFSLSGSSSSPVPGEATLLSRPSPERNEGTLDARHTHNTNTHTHIHTHTQHTHTHTHTYTHTHTNTHSVIFSRTFHSLSNTHTLLWPHGVLVIERVSLFGYISSGLSD